MKGSTKNQKKELLIYLALWIILFVAPLFSTYLDRTRLGEDMPFPWNDLWHIWRQYFILLAAFLIHNFLLAPLLIYRQKRALYSLGVILLLSVYRYAVYRQAKVRASPSAFSSGRQAYPYGHATRHAFRGR